MVTNVPLPTQPTITWSDLTSDSVSIRSSLRLDRIDEEEAFNEYDEDIELSRSEAGSPLSLSELKSSPLPRDPCPEHDESADFIAHWNDQMGDSDVATYSDDELGVIGADYSARWNYACGDFEPATSVDDSIDVDDVIEVFAEIPLWFEEQTPVASNRSKESPINDFAVDLADVGQPDKVKGQENEFSTTSTKRDAPSAESYPALDPKLADWASGVLQKLTGSVLLLTCGTEEG